MTNEEKIIELEKRIVELERRPVYINQPYPVYIQPPVYTPVPNYPTWYFQPICTNGTNITNG